MTTITSMQNPRVKNAVRLRERKHRDRHGRFLIDGARELRRAIEAGIELVEVFVCRELCKTDDARRVLVMLERTPADVIEVSELVFSKQSFGNRDEGVLGVAATPATALAGIRLPEVPLVAVLEGVEKPGNVGAVLRSADGAGVDAVVLADCHTDLFNPNAIRASLGTVFTLPVATAATTEVLDWLRREQLAIFAARVDGSVPYTQADYRPAAALVLGAEATGLSSAWNGPEVTAVGLPMLGTTDSLNVSTTAAVLFYEARRQRG